MTCTIVDAAAGKANPVGLEYPLMILAATAALALQGGGALAMTDDFVAGGRAHRVGQRPVRRAASGPTRRCAVRVRHRPAGSPRPVGVPPAARSGSSGRLPARGRRSASRRLWCTFCSTSSTDCPPWVMVGRVENSSLIGRGLRPSEGSSKETAKGIGNTVAEGAKFSRQTIEESSPRSMTVAEGASTVPSAVFRQARASNTRLNGVSAARRNRVKPALVATCLSRASPACAPRAAPTSCASEFGVHSIVDAA
jgi:hypothetical protein